MVQSLGQYSVNDQLTACIVASTENIAGVYFNGNNGIGSTLTGTVAGDTVIDDYQLNLGDRVLLAGQTNSYENGIYIAINPGSSTSVFVLQRAFDFQSPSQMREGQFVPIGAGTANAGKMFIVVNPLPEAIGVDGINFVSKAEEADAVPVDFVKAVQHTFAGGATTSTILFGGASGVTANSVAVASFQAQTNPVNILEAEAGSNQVLLTYSADPGACIVNCIVFLNQQS